MPKRPTDNEAVGRLTMRKVILPNRPADNEAGDSGAAQAGPAWNRPAESARPPPISAAARQGIFLWISYLYSIWFRR